jgi:hypothetical protein
MAPAIEGTLDGIGCFAGSTDAFHDEIDLRIGDEPLQVAREQLRRNPGRALFMRIAYCDPAKLVANAGLALYCIALVQEPFGDAAADSPATE